MKHNFVLFYVADPAASAEFYRRLLGREPVQSSPSFVLFALDSGILFGLWRRPDVEPEAQGSPGSSEICFAEPGDEAVVARFRVWRAAGVAIAQEPTGMDFGFTFVGVDPDGHRLRVYAPRG